MIVMPRYSQSGFDNRHRSQYRDVMKVTITKDDVYTEEYDEYYEIFTLLIDYGYGKVEVVNNVIDVEII